MELEYEPSLPRLTDFSYENLMRDSKREHGILSIKRDDQWFKDMHYEILETGGFLRLYTARGKLYWMAQNATSHLTPDWKIHFSISQSHLAEAWNIISSTFVEKRCEVGMKVTTSGSSFSEGPQRGREITVYIFQYDPIYGSGPMWDKDREGRENFIGEDHLEQFRYYLGREYEAPYDADFWVDFIKTSEERLEGAEIPSNGLADGDLSIPNCKYASLRNEAFVKVKDDDKVPQYPPNSCGWNAANHPNPLQDVLTKMGSRSSTQ
eukprot:TRINITY_DN2116_c0_g2_i1.p1 TRINITY_DN2116_c0_g2~~TRINITY_DN2116_c0_g2_i1.p1  ORF type:complete len:265 (+),score=94.20 TRINITY_DN2116_c0_g2_i1:105-899(+)